MRAFDPEVVDVIWRTVEPLLPQQVETHPLGCHRPRVPGRVCFRGILIRLVTGASWVDIAAILDRQVSDTTLRARRDEWIEAGCWTRSRPKRSRHSIGSSGSTWMTPRRFTSARPNPLGVVLTLTGRLALALLRRGGRGR